VAGNEGYLLLVVLPGVWYLFFVVFDMKVVEKEKQVLNISRRNGTCKCKGTPLSSTFSCSLAVDRSIPDMPNAFFCILPVCCFFVPTHLASCKNLKKAHSVTYEYHKKIGIVGKKT